MQRSIWDSARSGWKAVGDFLYPPYCLCCRGSLDPAADEPFPVYLCEDCRAEMVAAAPCQRCGAPVGPHLQAQDRCQVCRDEPYAFARTFCLGTYDGHLRNCCLRAKSRGGMLMATTLTRFLAGRRGNDVQDWGADFVVAVPTDRRTALLESHRACDTVAEQTARLLNTPWNRKILRKTRRTPRQTDVVPSMRRRNLRGAFAVRPGLKLSNERVLIVDDVMTTGATAHEVAKVLLRAGASEAAVLVIARSLGPYRAVPGHTSPDPLGPWF